MNVPVSCLVPQCARPVTCRGYCACHYQTVWYKTNRPNEYFGAKKKQRVKPWHRFVAYKGKPGIKEKWFLTFEEYQRAIIPNCYYCGGFFGKTTTGGGLDRVENSKGYTVDNVVSCCHFCNRIKQDLLTANETLQVISVLKQLRKAA